MATIGERIIEIFGGVTADKLQDAIARASEAAYYDANDEPPSGDLASFGYRRSTASHLRDFSGMPHDKILETIWSLWQSSPIAKRTMTLKRDHIVGTGAQFETDDEDLSEIITDFYDNNDLDQRLPEFGLQLRLLGEQCYPAFVRKSDGRTSLGYIDPGQIDEVVTHPGNAMQRWIVVTKGAHGSKKAYRIIREDKEFVEDGKVIPPTHPGKLVTHEQAKLQKWETAVLDAAGVKGGYSGSVFFFPINCLSNQPRGYSDLVQVADWIDAADETLFALAEREQMAGYFTFDVTLTGADAEQVKARAIELRKNPPRKGSVNVHNDAEEWHLHSPDLKQGGTITTFVGLLTFIMGGLGFPVAYYGYGDDTNRSTLQEQANPSEKTLEHDQSQFQKMMLFIAQFVTDQAEIAKKWKPTADIDSSIRLPLPAIRSEDIKGLVLAFSPLVAALVQAEESRMVSHDTAARMAHKLLNEMGAEIDTEQELEEIEGEELETEQGNNDKLAGMMGQNGNGRSQDDNKQETRYIINGFE